MDAATRARLIELVGTEAVDEARGAAIPASADMVATICRHCADSRTRLAVSSSPGGRAPEGALLLSLERLTAIRIDVGATVVRAEAGANVGELVTVASASGMRPVGAGWSRPVAGHVGSLVARGGVPRRALCGIEAVLASGEAVRAGGGVLKDVTGYDLAGVLLGSRGRLAVITAVHLRLIPTAEPAEPEVAAAAPADGSVLAELVRGAFDPASLLVS
jgi:glycolate oxidase